MFNFGFLLGIEQYMPIILIVGIFLLMYLFMIRPQRKREKEDAAMRDAVQVGDEVTTIGGIIGKVVSVKGETFVLETTKDKTKIRFLKGAIRSVDVRAADIAATILETREAEAAEKEEDSQTAPQAPEAVEAPMSKRAARKARKEAAMAAAEAMIAEGNEEAATEESAEEAPVEAVAEEAASEEVATEETATNEAAEEANEGKAE